MSCDRDEFNLNDASAIHVGANSFLHRGDMINQQGFAFDDADSITRQGVLNVVHARADDVKPFNRSLFENFSSLCALTYTSSIPMIVGLLRDYDYDRFECIFGHNGILSREAEEILAFQRVVDEKLTQGFLGLKGLSEERREIIYDRVASGNADFFVVKDAIAHAKIYLLEREDLRRVIVGSANLSEVAFSGRQAETLIVFDNDEIAWRHYSAQYTAVRDISVSHLPLRKEPIQIEITHIEETPALRDADSSKDGVTLYIPGMQAEEAEYAPSQILSRVETVRPVFRRGLADLRPNKDGILRFTSKIVRQITHVVVSRQVAEGPQTYLSLTNGRFMLSDKEMSLDPDEQEVRSDVANWIEFFSNYDDGFVGDVARLQRDYYTFMCWFYFSPLMCDLRNAALRRDSFSFDQPMFAILYGSSNCGKTSLVETLMRSMFSYPRIVGTQDFTPGKLRGLQQSYKRFPVVFDDVTRDRFNRYAPEIIKDESIPYGEYPSFALSMNADARSFPVEIVKRSLMIYTRTSLPGNDTIARRRLQRSVGGIRDKMTTALFREYLKRILLEVASVNDSEDDIPDALELSSKVLCDLIQENLPSDVTMPSWCRSMTLEEYQARAFERPRLVLEGLLNNDRYSSDRKPPEGSWTVSGDTIIVSVAQMGSAGLRSDVPDWILDDARSSAGQIALRRTLLEEFLGRPVKTPRRWFPFIN